MTHWINVLLGALAIVAVLFVFGVVIYELLSGK